MGENNAAGGKIDREKVLESIRRSFEEPPSEEELERLGLGGGTPSDEDALEAERKIELFQDAAAAFIDLVVDMVLAGEEECGGGLDDGFDAGADDLLLRTFTFVGWSGAGKTTFLERVVAELSARGLRVGVIKHHGHASPSSLDVEGKDSWRYAQAGARAVAVSSATEYQVHRAVERERSLDELVAEVGPGCDIVIAEGFRTEPVNPIEFSRAAVSEEPILDPRKLVAAVTDSERLSEAAAVEGVPVFGLDEPEALADFLCLEIGM